MASGLGREAGVSSGDGEGTGMAGRLKGSPFSLCRPHTLARPSSHSGTAQSPPPQADIWVPTHLAAGSSPGLFFKAPVPSIPHKE